ncbi:hypothetical protein [Furfurilactobacillus rossiae]|uniref:hypothetical protein n=1 Tax=Furfurilactobacillus rossiae TaxID=231049 RepID=UPI0002E494FA|nr:hypothetical protein [Furfurilactobacillus rossiae]QFR67414.1 hypothetical protein LR814_10010 [Furfurilactobacillus rossiae]QLE60356.1 hypothetical protein LROSRS0_0308 [Furfurilactobacillus rossiae]
MTLNSFVVEGAAEKAILDILVENCLLNIQRDTFLENNSGKIIFDSLNPRKFAKDFLNHDFDEPVQVHVLLDNPNKKLDFSKYSNQVGLVKYYVTREEIETIHLYHNENWLLQYGKYKQHMSGKDAKPSAFFINHGHGGLGITNIKQYDYVYNLWCNAPQELVAAIKHVQTDMKHKHSLRSFPRNYGYLADLLK